MIESYLINPPGSKRVKSPPTFNSVTSQSEPPKARFNGLNSSQPDGDKSHLFSIPGPSNTASPPLNPQAQSFKPPFTLQPAPPTPITQRKPLPSSILISSSLADNTKHHAATLPSFSPLPTSTTNGAVVSPPPLSSSFNSYKPSATPLRTSPPTTSVNGRLTAPPLLKININTSTSSGPTSPTAGSPQIPPPLSKPKPIPLPLTPSTSIHPPNPLLDHLRGNLDTPGTPRTPEMLSPLFIGTPTASGSKSLHNFSPFLPSKSTKPDTPTINGNSKAPQIKYDENQVEDMKNKALMFAQRSLLVKDCFKRWLKVATDRAEWLEACRQGDAYREKVHSRSRPASPPNGKRRISDIGLGSSEVNNPPVQRKRARRRISGQYRPPRTDEELAKRFKEVQTVLVTRFLPHSMDLTDFLFPPSLFLTGLLSILFACVCTFSRTMKSMSSAGLKDRSFKSYENMSKCAVRLRRSFHGRYGCQ